MYISGKDKLGYINGDLPQSPSTNPFFHKWRTDNAIVKGWLINSMDPSLIGNFMRFPIAKMVWDSIAIAYFDGSNTSQCAIDIHKYNIIIQEDWVYVFLDGFDNQLDKIRGDVLQLRPFPTVEQAYAYVRREASRQTVMITNNENIPGVVLATKGLRLRPTNSISNIHHGKQKS
ncbi:uncharacterized protein [Populus alba]|uniref:uncharacterized protein n=1 Tax=Populus alba TaxID=43335 RepID=UPI003CC7434E